MSDGTGPRCEGSEGERAGENGGLEGCEVHDGFSFRQWLRLPICLLINAKGRMKSRHGAESVIPLGPLTICK